MEPTVQLVSARKIFLVLVLIWNQTTATTKSSGDGHFTCQGIGIFPDEMDCSNYYICLRISSSYLVTHLRCPLGMNFDEQTRQCMYQFPCHYLNSRLNQTENYTAATTEESTILAGTNDAPSDCGKYPNLNDPTCTTYYRCSRLSNGSYSQRLHRCPDNSYFDPVLQDCNETFMCQCSYCEMSSSSIEMVNNDSTIQTSTTKPMITSDISLETSTYSEADLTTIIPTAMTFFMTSADIYPCIYVNNPYYFSCHDEGRYSNLNDPTCQTFNLCNVNSNGSFTKALYLCPQGSIFNPESRECDTSIQCPCEHIMRKQNFKSISTLFKKPYDAESISHISISTYNSDVEINPAAHWDVDFEKCNYIGNSEYFSCNSRGRFRNLNDLTCQTYYLCDSLGNGSYIQTEYSCPNESYFHSITQECETNYTCPCEDFSTLTSDSLFTSTIASQTDGSVSVDKTTISEITSTIINTTTEPCEYMEDSEYFSCSSKGRYRNLNDRTCRTYYLCSQLRNGSFIRTPYTCPDGSYFNQVNEKCEANYKCPCESASSSTSESISSSSPTAPTQTDDSESENETTSSEVTSTISDTTSELCEFIEDSGYFSCSSRGRYRNLNDPTCQTYYLCSKLRNGSFIQTPYTCPDGSYFNQVNEKCEANYKCPCESVSLSTSLSISTSPPTVPTQTDDSESENETTSSEVTSTISDTTSELCEFIEDSGYISCSSRGRYRNLNDPTCRTYYLCSKLRNGSFIQTPYTCPDGSFFNQVNEKCEANYKCPCESVSSSTSESISTSSSTVPTQTDESVSVNGTTSSKVTSTISDTTSESCEFIEDSSYFSCSSKGRYRNLNDPTCQTYYLCSKLRNGSFIQTPYTCPDGSYFNQVNEKCEANYKCPCESVSLSTSGSISTSSPTVPTQTDDSESENETTSSKVTSTISDTTSESCEFIEDSSYFSCSSKGRYRNLNDPTCQTYYLCSKLRNGSFIQTPYTCPDGSYFNQVNGKCEANYKCPCESVSLSTSGSISTSSPTVPTQTDDSESENETTSSEVTSIISDTTSESCEFIEDSGYFSCSSKGRYRNLNDPTCQTYYLCSKLRNGSFIQTPYTCPDGSYFNQVNEKCEANYKCPCESVSLSTSGSISTSSPTAPTQTDDSVSVNGTTSSEVTSTISDTTSESCEFIEDSSYFSCSSKGRYRNLNDPTCQTYYLCSKLRNGSFIQTPYICPDGSYFNQVNKKCEANYKCPCESVSPSTSDSVSTSSPTAPTQTDDSVSVNGTTSSEVTSTISDTTSESCEFIEDSGYFSCSSRGRYRNLNDPTCQTYYLCSKLRNGSFIQTPYTCPVGSYFSQVNEKCEANYKCPCESVSSSTSESEPTSSPTVSTQTDDSVSVNGTTSSEVTSTISDTTSESCEFIEDSGYFSCSSKGRYRNLNDPTCQTYYLCSKLRNGSFIQTPYTCPDGSYFNQVNEKCEANYKCPCDSVSPSTSDSISTSSPTVPTQTDDSESENETTSSKVTSTISDTTSELCEFIEDSGYFSCSSKGRYRNLNDPTCQTYYLCSKLRNGSFIQTPYTCPDGSYFNQVNEKCEANYKCPCESVSPSTSESISTSSSTVPTQTDDSVSVNETKTTSSEVTSTISDTTSESCEFIEDSGYFSCSSKGRYRNLNDPTCQTYYLCSKLRNGSFIQTPYTCPDGSYFNQVNEKCEANYKCPCESVSSSTSESISTSSSSVPTQTDESVSVNGTTTTSSEVTSTISDTTSESCEFIEDSSYFSCSSKGRYRNLNDPTCQTYYLCSKLRNGSFIQTPYTCPDGSYFNQVNEKCEANYECPCESVSPSTSESISTSSPTVPTQTDDSVSVNGTTTTSSEVTSAISDTTSGSCEFIEDSGYFSCSSKGRYRNLNDPTCQTYYLCSKLRNGSFIQTPYTCPDGSYFNQVNEKCEANYKCPCDSVSPSTSESVSTSSATVSTQTDESVSVNGTTTTSSEVTSTISDTTSESCEFIENSSYFSCSSKGRYRNLNDPTCQTYYLCSKLRNGSFIQTPYTCPDGSYFNQVNEKCEANYECPCESVSPSTSESISTSSPTVPTQTDDSVSVNGTTTTSSEVTSTISDTTSGSCEFIEDSGYFSCSSKGRYRNLNDPTCQTYYLCSKLRNGSFIQTPYTCPDGSYFNQVNEKCEANYKCPCDSVSPSISESVSTSSPTVPTQTDDSVSVNGTTTTSSKVTSTISDTTSGSCEFIEDAGYFSCSSKGRYRNLNDPTCQTYYLCSKLRNGSFIQTPYTCPDGSYFNELNGKCEANYKCPCESFST